MQNQFSRTQLLLGKPAIDTLNGSRVAVFGIGGVGGYVVEVLARSGIGEMDLFDDDRVCLTNVNRQIYALISTVGRHKVDVAAERIHHAAHPIQRCRSDAGGLAWQLLPLHGAGALRAVAAD